METPQRKTNTDKQSTSSQKTKRPLLDAIFANKKQRERTGTETVHKIANSIANNFEQTIEDIPLPREKVPFKIDITGWIVGKDNEGNKILHNQENDIWQYLDGPLRDIQYFSLEAARRETKQHNKKLAIRGKDLRIAIEKKYRPKTQKLLEELNFGSLENREQFIEKEQIQFLGGITPKGKLAAIDEIAIMWCEDGSAFCIESDGADNISTTKGSYYSVPKFNEYRKLPVYYMK